IFLTALGGEEERVRGFRLGADDYLPKPFRFEELDTRVERALQKTEQVQAKMDEVTSAPIAVADAGRPAAIHGTLEQLGLSSLLVMIEMERKSGILRLSRPSVTGRIFVREGRVVAARLEGDRAPKEARRGAEAVYHMLTWSAGAFDFTAVEVEMEDEVN